MHATTCAAPIHLDADMPAVQLEAVHEPTCMRIGTAMRFYSFLDTQTSFISTFALMRGFGRSALNGRDKLKIL